VKALGRAFDQAWERLAPRVSTGTEAVEAARFALVAPANRLLAIGRPTSTLQTGRGGKVRPYPACGGLSEGLGRSRRPC